MSSCSHLGQLGALSPPRLSQSVHREECTQCFDNQDLDVGIDVCLTCFNGGCLGPDRHHSRTHFEKSRHNFTLNVKRKLKPSTKRSDEGEPPAKRLAIVEERDEDKYEFTTTLRCWSCGGVELEDEIRNNPKAKELSDGVMSSMSSARQSEVKSWEEEIVACEHTLTLDQYPVGHIPASGLAHCNQCDLKANLWLCLTCGNLGCGRSQAGGVEGNGHGLGHYMETKHPVSVKLGTITAEGTADLYCYECDDSKLDPELAHHLSTFGINVHSQTKTEKTMTELQLEQNLSFEFSLTGDDGKALEPLFGPGLTGLGNLGNSCYMASVLQTVFSLDSFRAKYQNSALEHAATCTSLEPATCLSCQMYKIADGLLSGRYSHPRRHLPEHSVHSPNPDEPIFQDGLRPSMFKALVGKGHEEFSTMKQQDSEEFFTHLLKVLRADAKRRGVEEKDEATDVFRFGVEQRLQCNECQKVRYRVDEHDTLAVPVPATELPKAPDAAPDAKVQYEPVELEGCLQIWSGSEALEYHCPSCNKNVIAHRRSSFSTFPQILVIQAKKFQLVNWVPTKLDIQIKVPASDELLLDGLLGRGLQDSEVALPDDTPSAPALPAFHEDSMNQLQGMGFSVLRSQKALLATGNNNAEAAMEWLFAHMEDPDIDDAIQLPGARGKPSAPEPSEEQVAMLADMGFTHAQAKKALRETGGSADRAVEWLFSHPDDMGDEPTGAPPAPPAPRHPGGSATLPARYRLKAFISHKGPSVHSGHYVAHIRVDSPEGPTWVLFNDEKVVKAGGSGLDDLKSLAYLYIFERI